MIHILTWVLGGTAVATCVAALIAAVATCPPTRLRRPQTREAAQRTDAERAAAADPQPEPEAEAEAGG
jgi:hypothetical protein